MTALPSLLDRFGAELEVAVRRDLGARRGVAGCCARPPWLGQPLRLRSGSWPSCQVVGPPSSARRGRARGSDHTILHGAARRAAQPRRERGHLAVGELAAQRSPFTRRQIEFTRGDSRRVPPAATRTSSTTRRGNDLHRHSAGAPGRQPAQDQDRLEGPAGAADAQPRATSALKIRKSGGYSAIATKRRRRAPGAAPGHGIRRRWAGGGAVPGRDPRALDSGRAEVTGHVEVDGRDAIRIESPDGDTHLVDAESYAPIEWTSRR